MERWELPQGWGWRRLSEISVINPQRPPIQRNDDEPTSFIPMQAVDEFAGRISLMQTRPYREVKRGYTYFEENDVLLAKITPSMENGKVAIARGLLGGIGFGTTEFHVFHPDSRILPEWIFYYIRRKTFREEAKNNFRGAVGQQRVPEDFLIDYPIPLPYPDDPRRSLAEQRRIAARLETLLGEARALRQEFQSIRRGLAQVMEAALAEVFPDPQGEVKEGWGWKSVDDLFELQQGASMSPRRRQGENPQPFLRTKNILWGEVHTTDVDVMDFTDDEIERLKLEKGDLLICEGGDVGRAAVWEAQLPLAMYQNHIHRLRRKSDDVEPKFYMYWMKAAYQVFRIYQGEESRTAIPNLSGGRLKNFLVPQTSLAEQRRIVTCLDRVAAQTRAIEALLEQDLRDLDALEESILAEAFGALPPPARQTRERTAAERT